MIDQLYEYLLLGACVILGICLLFVIIKSIIGPKVADRVVSVNMASTIVVMMICLLTAYYHEGYLDDVALIYVLISFVAVVVLTNLFINVNMRKKDKLDEMKKEEEK